MSFPGLENSGLCGCSWCRSHSTPLNILVKPSLNLFPSSYFWNEDRCALCGATVQLWSASTISVAARPVFYPILVTLLKMSITSAAENQSTAGLQQGFWLGGTLVPPLLFLVQSWLQEQIPAKLGKLGTGREFREWGAWRINTSEITSCFLTSLILDGITIIFFPPARQSCEMNVILLMLPRLTTMSFVLTGCPA